MTAPLRLSEVLGARVRDARGGLLGRVADIEVVGHERFPPASAVLVRSHGQIDRVGVEPVARGGVVITGAANDEPVPAARLLLGRDVLDTQVVDLAGRRLARVSDVELAMSGRELRAVAVDVGLAAVIRRLGLRRLAGRLGDEPLAWDGLYLASGVGHRLHLEHRAAEVHRLSHAELEALVAHLPPARGAQVLEIARPGEHAEPVEVARRAGGRRRRFRVMRARRRAPS
jgi:sporulation protein YlmC with PRC-barrel domain